MLDLFRRLAPALPVSLVWFAFTGVVFLLQAIPITGIFLMLLLAPFWSIVTVNLGFVSLGVEALMGKTSRLWLLAPLAWFGGYAVAAHLSHMEFDRLDAQFRQANAGKSVPFSPERDALVFDYKGDGTLSGAASTFAAEYGLPVAYEANKNFKTASHIAHRTGDAALCTELRDPAYGNAGIHAFVHGGRKGTAGVCRYTAPEDPVLPAVRVGARGVHKKGESMPAGLTHIEITRDGAAPVQLTTGMAAPLSWWPLPTIGCWLNSGSPSWQCEAGFMRERLRGLGGEGAYGGAAIDVLATALGLSKTEPGERPTAADPAALARLRQTITQSVGSATAMLDRMIADPTVRATVHDVPGLRERPDILVPRADGMVRAIGQALDGGHRTREVGTILQSFLAQLPPSDFQRIGPAVLAELAARGTIDSNQISAELAARLGDLGAPAIPVLERLAFASGRRAFAGAIFGLCRVGAPAAHFADTVAAQLAGQKRSSGEIHAAAYVTLLRMGRPDLADSDPDADGRYARKHYESWRASVTPSSPPSVCVSSHGWPRLPGGKS